MEVKKNFEAGYKAIWHLKRACLHLCTLNISPKKTQFYKYLHPYKLEMALGLLRKGSYYVATTCTAASQCN
jgi:hypothetical protein